MSRYDVRPLRSEDFSCLMALEEEIFGGDEPLLGPYYLRVCTEMFGDTCFIARVDGRAVGYLLAFMRGREAWCTTLAVHPEFQGSRVIVRLMQAFVRRVHAHVDTCWFTAKEDNHAAAAMHTMLGASDVCVREDFYAAGDRRVVRKIDQDAVMRLAGRYARLGLVDDAATAAPVRFDARLGAAVAG